MLADGQTAESGKAAGWFSLELRDGELWATDVQWTEPAAKALAAREYRFFSPAVELDDDGRAMRLINVALTNLPATKGLTPLVASQLTDGDEMASEHQIALLSATGAATVPAAIVYVQELKDKALQLAQKVNELEAKAEHEARETLIAELSREGKAAPAIHGFLRTLSLSQVKEFAAVAQRVAPVATKPATAGDSPVVLTALELNVCKTTGQDPVQFAKTKAALAARSFTHSTSDTEL